MASASISHARPDTAPSDGELPLFDLIGWTMLSVLFLFGVTAPRGPHMPYRPLACGTASRNHCPHREPPAAWAIRPCRRTDGPRGRTRTSRHTALRTVLPARLRRSKGCDRPAARPWG
ncbi:hypothetical protein GCM10010332_05280 [Streptomyces albogriseolus]|nr:hypothetical protein GCM10010332_05280 [Streptomyces albogriseolus]